ncbi:MAG: PEP-CTERM sorting domain-containing protein, partial [Planctomycetota bacterium]|nr:PEP-CTERM sorting domain-containing protein [Planctomycetota bacterium]
YHAGEMAILDDDGFRLTEVHFFDAATGARNGSVTIDFSGLFPENDLVGAGYDGSYVSFFDQDGGTQLQVHRFDAITGALVDSSVVVDHGGFFASNDLMGTGMIDVPEPSHAMLLLGASGLWIAGRRPRREEAA